MRATIGLALMSMWFGVAGASAETHRFTPSTFYNTFSFAHPPALRIKPGDRVITVTIDAFGNDASDRRVASAPNPQTDPFFVEGAEPGDMLVVTFTVDAKMRKVHLSGPQA
jgi:amidase